MGWWHAREKRTFQRRKRRGCGEVAQIELSRVRSVGRSGMDLVVVEGSQGVSRHGVRSWCGVVGGTWQRFPEIASENEQKLSLRGVLSLGKG